MNYNNLKTASKKLVLVFAMLAFFAFNNELSAQRIATVDINLVMESLNDYQSAQKQLDETAARWRREIAEEYDVIKGLYNKYQAEQVLMSEDMRLQKEEEIMKKEKEVRELQKSKFGPEGALFQKRQDLVQPIQDRVFAAIEDFANNKGYDFILDKSSASGIIFANSRYDKTEEILKALTN